MSLLHFELLGEDHFVFGEFLEFLLDQKLLSIRKNFYLILIVRTPSI